METIFQKWQWHQVPHGKIAIPFKLNAYRKVNRVLEEINEKIPEGTIITGWAETQEGRKKQIMSNYVFPVNVVVYSADFIFHRILPKFNRLTSAAYFYITKGRNRVLSKAEILGRIYSCGFIVEHFSEEKNVLRFVAKKMAGVSTIKNSWWPIFAMPRVGRHGKIIMVYKLRTMHPYSEYLQSHILQHNGLEKGGKFKDDFRISSWGRFLRKYWIDEIPMIINVIKGDLKIVGVRPLSQQYYHMYPDKLKMLRNTTKPGLFPPFYADLPSTIEEIIASEEKYLELYKLKPLATDLQYLFKGINNILFKKIRSK